MVRNMSASCDDCTLKNICMYRPIRTDLLKKIEGCVSEFESQLTPDFDLDELLRLHVTCKFFSLVDPTSLKSQAVITPYCTCDTRIK